MSDTTTDAPANNADTAVAAAAAKAGEAVGAAVSDQAGAQAKLSDQYLSTAQSAPNEAGKVAGKAIGPLDCDKTAQLEKDGILPPGKGILHDGPNEMKGRGHEGISQTGTETVQVLPDGTKVITDTTTTVIPPHHDHEGFKEGMAVPGVLKGGEGMSHLAPNGEGISHPWGHAEGKAFPAAQGQYPQGFRAGIPAGGEGGGVIGKTFQADAPPNAVAVPDVPAAVNQ